MEQKAPDGYVTSGVPQAVYKERNCCEVVPDSSLLEWAHGSASLWICAAAHMHWPFPVAVGSQSAPGKTDPLESVLHMGVWTRMATFPSVATNKELAWNMIRLIQIWW